MVRAKTALFTAVPDWFSDDSLYVVDRYGDALSTSILLVYFELGATQPEKQAAVDLVDGRVVGGARFAFGGLYYIEIEGDGTLAGIERVAERLSALPKVWHAEPHGLRR